MKRKVICLLLAIILVMSFGIGYMMNVSAANEDDRSFFPLGSAASAAFADAVYKDKTMDFSNIDSGANSANSIIGNYGGVMGYTSGEDGVIMGWLQTATSMAQSDVSYAALQAIKGCTVPVAYSSGAGVSDWLDDISSGGRSAVWYYCQYGYLLNDLGFDKTGGNGMHPIKFISGFMLMMGYICSLIVPVVFEGVLNLLQTLNPFQLFYNLKEIKPDALLGGTTITGAPPTPLVGLANMISTWYAWFQQFSEFFIIPMLFVFVVLTLLLNQRAQRMGAIRKFVTRLCIIFLCIPVCGACYTGALSQSIANVDKNIGQSAKIVQSTLIDFERWAQTTHLRPAIGMNMGDSEGGDIASGASDITSYNVRNMAYRINKLSGKENWIVGNVVDIIGGCLSSASGGGPVSNWNTTVQSQTGLTNVNQSEVIDTLDLITRHMMAEFYTASDFESYAKSLMTAENSGVTSEQMDDLWSASSSASSFGDSTFTFADEAVSTNERLNIWADGSLRVTGNGTSFTADNDYGLSTMSMYNYLNTKFDRTGATMYTVDSSSDFVRQSHYSVNLVGNNVMAFMYWADALVMLVAITIVGLCYAVSMLVGTVKRSFKFISSMPFALMGNLRAGARIITYVAMMLIEIVGTFFIYDMVTSILLSLSNIIEAPMEKMIGDLFKPQPAAGGEGVILASAILIGVMILSIVVVVAFTIMAIRLRKALLKSFDEMAANVIEKFIVGDNHPAAAAAGNGSQGSMKDGFGQGAVMGAAMAGKNGQGRKDEAKNGAKGTKKDVSGTNTNGMGQGGIEGVGAQGDPMNALPGLPGDTGSASASSMMGEFGSAGGGMSGVASGSAAGGGGAGSAAGIVTNAAFAKNNQAQQDKNLGEKLLGSNRLEKREKRKQQQEAKDRAFVAEAMGNVGAMNEERVAEETKAARKEANKERMQAVAQTVVGAAEVAGAAMTGDASLAKDGVDNVANGVAGTRDANEKIHDIQTSEAETKLSMAQANRQVQAVDNTNTTEKQERESSLSTESGTNNTKSVAVNDTKDQKYETNTSGSSINTETKGHDDVNQNVTRTVQANQNQKTLTMQGKSASNAKALGAGRPNGVEKPPIQKNAVPQKAGGSGMNATQQPKTVKGANTKQPGSSTRVGVPGQSVPGQQTPVKRVQAGNNKPAQRTSQPSGSGMSQQRPSKQVSAPQPKPTADMRPVRTVNQNDMSITRGVGVPRELSRGNFDEIPREVYAKYGIDYNNGKPRWGSAQARDSYYKSMGYVPDWEKGILYAPGKK